MPPTASSPHATILDLTRAISTSRTVQEIYAAALDALGSGLGVERSSILLFDADGVMRFKAYRWLSDAYRQAVEGHTPWTPDSPEPQPIVVADVHGDASLAAFLPVLAAEGIAALTFIPLVSLDRVIGKFMLYYATPAAPTVDELQLACVIAAQVAFAVERTRAEEHARRSEERLRFALDAASMGTWDWDLTSNTVRWSENLAGIHGLPPGAFDGTFASYEREIHPDDRPRVLASLQRAIAEGVPHDVEYRIVAPDGTVRWCEGTGRVEYRDGRAVAMSGVCVMVTRRKEAELARLAAAEEASRLKDDFLATLSHELRTPLNAILGWVPMLQSGTLTSARAQQAIEVIGRNAGLQAQLIEDILDVSRIISGKLVIDVAPVAMPALLDAVVAGVSVATEAKRIAVECRIAGDLPPIEGDPKRLQQVLNNVLVNAVKFTPEGGAITIDSRVSGRGLEVEIRDTGVGIAPDFLPYVFDRFRQADSRPTRNHGGLGLGLAIARHLIEQHGGTIAAHSDGVGLGTTVTIRLPVPSQSVIVPVPWPPADDAVRLDGMTIAVVDDQPDSLEVLAAVLEQRGARVHQCKDARSVVHVLNTQPLELLIADIAMPHVDGYELIARLRQQGCTIPAIAVTAFARSEDRQRALAAGYTAYCVKPIDGPSLAKTVRNLVLASPGA